MTLSVIDAALLVLVVLCALGAALLRDLLAVIIVFAAYSLGVSIIWLLLRAPDVALTEAAVGAGIMSLLFLLALANTTRPSTDELFESVEWRPLLGVGAFVIVMAATVPHLPAIGSSGAANPVVGGEVTEYYLANAYEETEVKNAVTAVLAAYRGFDTLGEAVVVFTAGVAALTVLRKEVFA